MNELINRKDVSMTTAANVAEIKDLFEKAERALRRLGNRGGNLVRQIIARGDAQGIGALTQVELQALMSSVPNAALVDVVRLHKLLTEYAVAQGIDVGPPPPSDDDIVVYSSGR